MASLMVGAGKPKHHAAAPFTLLTPSSAASDSADVLQKRLHVEVSKLEAITSRLALLKRGEGQALSASEDGRRRAIATLQTEMDRQVLTVEALVRETQRVSLSATSTARHHQQQQQRHSTSSAADVAATAVATPSKVAKAPSPNNRAAPSSIYAAAVSRRHASPAATVNTRTVANAQRGAGAATAFGKGAEGGVVRRPTTPVAGGPDGGRRAEVKVSSPLVGGRRATPWALAGEGPTPFRRSASPTGPVMVSAGAMRFGRLAKETRYAAAHPGDAPPSALTLSTLRRSQSPRGTAGADKGVNHRATPSMVTVGGAPFDVPHRHDSTPVRAAPPPHTAGADECGPLVITEVVVQDGADGADAATPFRVFTVNMEDVMGGHGSGNGLPLAAPVPLPTAGAATPDPIHAPASPSPASLAPHESLLRDVGGYRAYLEQMLGRLVLAGGGGEPSAGAEAMRQEVAAMLLEELRRMDTIVSGVTGDGPSMAVELSAPSCSFIASRAAACSSVGTATDPWRGVATIGTQTRAVEGVAPPARVTTTTMTDTPLLVNAAVATDSARQGVQWSHTDEGGTAALRAASVQTEGESAHFVRRPAGVRADSAIQYIGDGEGGGSSGSRPTAVAARVSGVNADALAYREQLWALQRCFEREQQKEQQHMAGRGGAGYDDATGIAVGGAGGGGDGLGGAVYRMLVKELGRAQSVIDGTAGGVVTRQFVDPRHLLVGGGGSSAEHADGTCSPIPIAGNAEAALVVDL